MAFRNLYFGSLYRGSYQTVPLELSAAHRGLEAWFKAADVKQKFNTGFRLQK